MKRNIILGIAVVFTATSLVSTQVQASTATESGKERREVRQEIRQEKKEVIKSNMKERQEDRQENRQERRDQNLERIANRVEVRFKGYQEKTQNWLTRVSARITTLEESGKNMSAAKTAVEKVKTSLSSATTLGNQAVTLLRAVTPEAWLAQKEDVKAAKDAVKKAELAYAQVTKDMMSVLKEIKIAR